MEHLSYNNFADMRFVRKAGPSRLARRAIQDCSLAALRAVTRLGSHATQRGATCQAINEKGFPQRKTGCLGGPPKLAFCESPSRAWTSLTERLSTPQLVQITQSRGRTNNFSSRKYGTKYVGPKHFPAVSEAQDPESAAPSARFAGKHLRPAALREPDVEKSIAVAAGDSAHKLFLHLRAPLFGKVPDYEVRQHRASRRSLAKPRFPREL